VLPGHPGHSHGSVPAGAHVLEAVRVAGMQRQRVGQYRWLIAQIAQRNTPPNPGLQILEFRARENVDVPRLEVATRWRLQGCAENAPQHIGRHPAIEETPYGLARTHRIVDVHCDHHAPEYGDLRFRSAPCNWTPQSSKRTGGAVTSLSHCPEVGAEVTN
jgi:hypothetical protein